MDQLRVIHIIEILHTERLAALDTPASLSCTVLILTIHLIILIRFQRLTNRSA